MKDTVCTVEEYRLAWKDADSIYSAFAKRCGLSDTEYWIMVMIDEGCDTQSKISGEAFISKQTVNSAVRQLQKKGLVSLLRDDGDGRSKKMAFTPSGEEFFDKNFNVIDRAEERVWSKLSDAEKNLLVGLSKKYNDLLKKELETV